MIHAERLYLLARLSIRQIGHERAKAEGEVFHPVNSFIRLSSRFDARVLTHQDRIILQLRRADSTAGDARAEFEAFFGCPFTYDGMSEESGTTQHTGSAFARDVLNPLLPESRHVPDSTSGQPMAARPTPLAPDPFGGPNGSSHTEPDRVPPSNP